ncbi:sialidase family protein [Mucilaginibacter boryungensis]|uniref:Exo-alpha-sialidase n=1 Tax=Mucilaginibacter boryungensis TaxID=768480 RepID=A0ABR9XJD2_9SPHI|nr:sialidase family protein [Mucilaginibacter boryungensis]MBE9667159.1 exo-alpha-sialidase [Mucilaginibacter boryungensis]
MKTIFIYLLLPLLYIANSCVAQVDTVKDRHVTIPTIDLSADTSRQVIVESGTPDVYQGHPSTVLMPDGKTIFCVWTHGHAGPCGPMKRSDDGGKTWSPLLNTPDNWTKVYNAPTIYRLPGPDGHYRLFVFAVRGPERTINESYSEDDGKTWTPMKGIGLTTIVPFSSVIPIEGGKKLLAQANIKPPGATDEKGNLIGQSISADGGFTWSPWEIVLKIPGLSPSEPGIIRSPDGKQLLCLLRENARKLGALYMVSNDEGKHWSEAKETTPGLFGDRHNPHYAKDGRLVVTFRDVGPLSPTKDHFVAWVGTYDDIIKGRAGQYRIKLLHSYNSYDCGYAGLEQLPDNTFVTTTYIKYRPGPNKNSIISVRFKLSETDKMAKKIARR